MPPSPPEPTRRMRAVQTPIIPVVADLIRRHPGTISLGQGVVHYGPPPAALAQLDRFFAAPDHDKYKPVRGLPELVEAFGKKLREENNIDTASGSAVFVTAGSNLGFTQAILAITDPGDEVILQAPYYFNHEMAVTMANARPVVAPTGLDYQLDLAAIEEAITPRTRAIVTVSPNNPSGAVYRPEDLRAVNALCAARGLYHISDEAYEYFVYDGALHFSPGSIPGSAAHTISLFSLSKAYGFASWRIGFMVVPEHLAGAVNKIQDTLLICAPVISQFAAVGALAAGRDYCRPHLEALSQTRGMVLARLAELGSLASVPQTRGAFYCLVHVRTALDAMSVVQHLVANHGVAVVPGTAFGITEGCVLRIAYGALTAATVADGMNRLVCGLRAISTAPV